MFLYLLHSNGKYSNAAEYTVNPPFPALENSEWVEGIPEGLEAFTYE